MLKISIEEYSKKHAECNPGMDIGLFEIMLKETVKRKNSGVKCTICGAPIWALGSAAGGYDRCFTCITGESDDSKDYEVYE